VTIVDTPSSVFTRDLTAPCWGHTPFPDFITSLRDHQWDAFVAITNAYADGADVVLVDAPVGSGKTLIGEMVRRWMGGSTLYICSGKSLQDQFVRDFPYARVLKGRSNYPTADSPELFGDSYQAVTAADCTMERAILPACNSCPQPDIGWVDENIEDDTYSESEGGITEEDEERQRVPHCSECHPITRCPYRQAKAVAINSSLAVLNTSYFLHEANLAGSFSRRNFVIVDECDMLEKELMSFVQVSISARRRKKYGIEFPTRKTEPAGMRVQDDGTIEWVDWIDRTQARIATILTEFPAPRAQSRDQRKEVKYLQNLYGSLTTVRLRMDQGGWVYTDYEKGDITFKPVMVNDVGNDMLWAHANKWLLMSGTIIDPREMVESLGLPPEKRWEVVQVPMTFPRENRPVKVIPVAEMSAKNKAEAWPKIAAMCNDIAVKHADDRILIHSVSFKLTEYLVERLPADRVVTYTSAAGREPALAKYKSIDNGIIVGPSLDRGIDLPGDLCRVQVVCKLPFPYLGDKQISTRLYGTKGGQTWYLIQCIRSFVQMTGRGVRNDRDYAVTYILDKAFQNNIWKKARHLIPRYLKEAIDWSGRI
jgi:ATP-dependent DNA helicase DinG